MPKILMQVMMAVSLSLVLLACGGGAEGESSGADQQGISPDLPPLLVWQDALNITVVDPATGETIAAETQVRSGLQQVLDRPNLFLGQAMVGDDFGVYPLADGLPSPNGLWLARCQDETLTVRPINSTADLFSTAAAGCSALWSPDGTQLAFVGSDGLRVLNLDPSNIVLEAARVGESGADTNGVDPLGWSPDGTRLIGRQGDDVLLIDLAGQVRTLDLDGRDVQELHWSPDGAALWMRYGRGDFVRATNADQPQLVPIVRYQIATGEMTEIVGAGGRSGPLRFAVAPDGNHLAVWHADCRRVWSDLMPVLVLECTTQIRLLSVDEPSAWIGVGDPVTSRRPGAPNMRWADWQPPVQLPDLPEPEAASPEQSDGSQPAQTGQESADAFRFGDATTPGNTPQNPLPYGETYRAEDLQYQIVDVLSGAEARELISAASQNATILSPLPGTEHVAVKLRVDHTGSGLVEIGVTFFPRLMDARGSGVPHLFLIDGEEETERTTFRRPGPVEIWLAFLVSSDASDPSDGTDSRVLLLPQTLTTRQPLFLAVSPDATIPPSPIHEAMPVNTLGLTEAASEDERVVTSDWQLQVRTVQRFGASLEPGTVTVGVEMETVYQGEQALTCIGPDSQAQPPVRNLPMNGTMRASMSSSERVCYLPGGRHVGWRLYSVPADAQSLLLSIQTGPGDRDDLRQLTISVPQ